MLDIGYQCHCGHVWREQYETVLEGKCPECGEGGVGACEWKELPGVPDRPRVNFQVSRIINESVQIEARSEAEAIALAENLPADAWARDDCDEWLAEKPRDDQFILGLPIK